MYIINRLIEVERQIQAQKEATATSRTKSMLEAKLKDLERMKLAKSTAATTTATRAKLAEVERQISAERAKQTATKTKLEFENKQKLLRKMRRNNNQELDTDVAFVVDCTSSMHSHIEATKNNIREIIKEIQDR